MNMALSKKGKVMVASPASAVTTRSLPVEWVVTCLENVYMKQAMM
jgi:hypothetical protein